MTAQQLSDEQVREMVRERYAASATGVLTTGSNDGCCGDGCCGSTAEAVDPITSDLYDAADAPSETALAASLGCGNPTALAELHPGEDVLDLGSGGGLDVLLSARRVAPGGTAYGLDMTSEMLELARRNQAEAGIENARFIQGTIEEVPLPDAAVDVIISNCVVNLSPDKEQVYREAFRVLKPGGRLAISDVVAIRPIPTAIQQDFEKHSGCVAGALQVKKLERILRATGFANGAVKVKEQSKEFIKDWFPGSGVERYVRSADVQGMKPGRKTR